MPVYPGAIPAITSSWTHNQVAEEIEAIAAELGIDPSSPSITVVKRLTSEYDARHRPRFRSGFWYSSLILNTTTQTANQDACRATPFQVHAAQTFDRIGCEVTTAVASTTVRLGIYNDNGSGYPGSLVLDAGTVDSSTTGAKEIVISHTLQPGLYWLVNKAEGGAPTLRGINSQSPYLSFSLNGTGGVFSSWTQGSQPAGALANPFPTGASLTSNSPRVGVRAA